MFIIGKNILRRDFYDILYAEFDNIIGYKWGGESIPNRDTDTLAYFDCRDIVYESNFGVIVDIKRSMKELSQNDRQS